MRQYEYKHETLNGGTRVPISGRVLAMANELGKDGWELVSIITFESLEPYVSMYFKREVAPGQYGGEGCG